MDANEKQAVIDFFLKVDGIHLLKGVHAGMDSVLETIREKQTEHYLWARSVFSPFKLESSRMEKAAQLETEIASLIAQYETLAELASVVTKIDFEEVAASVLRNPGAAQFADDGSLNVEANDDSEGEMEFRVFRAKHFMQLGRFETAGVKLNRGVFCRSLKSKPDPEAEGKSIEGCVVFAWPEDTKTIDTLADKYGLIVEGEWESLDGREPGDVANG